MFFVVGLLFVSLSPDGVSGGSFYEKLSFSCLTGEPLQTRAVSSPNQTITNSKGYCSSVCNRLEGCGWFNYVDDNDLCNSQHDCLSGNCQLFLYQPTVVFSATIGTLWQRTNLADPVQTVLQPPSVPYSISPGLLVQQNSGGTTFDRDWFDYKVGFCNVNGDYWIGNDKLHQLTANGLYKARLELQALYDGQWYWAEYTTFIVDSEAKNYHITVTGQSGTTTDSWYYHNGRGFATRDRIDPWGCATGRFGNSGGFWYDGCAQGNINGSPLLYSSNGGEGFVWTGLPSANKYLQTSRLWLVLL